MRSLILSAAAIALMLPTAAISQSSGAQGSGAQNSGTEGSAAQDQKSHTQKSQGQGHTGMTGDAKSSSAKAGSSDKHSQARSAETTRSFQDIQQSLGQAGIKDIQVLDASYLVTAETKDGDPVTFVVDPPTAAAMGRAPTSGTPGSGSSTAGSQSSGQSSSQVQTGGQDRSSPVTSQQDIRKTLGQAGFTDIQIVAATYLARGTTESGDQITMMIEPGSGAAQATGSRSEP